MRVLVQDREGPATLSVLTAAVGLVMLLVGMRVWIEGSSTIHGSGSDWIGQLATWLGLFLVAVGIRNPFRFRSRVVPLDVRPGEVRVKRGLGTFRVRAGDVGGATTCEHEGKLALTMVLRGRPAPVTFLFDSTTDAERVRAALGLDWNGTGETHFPIEEPTIVRNARVFSAATAVLALGSLLLVVLRFAEAHFRGSFSIDLGDLSVLSTLITAGIGGPLLAVSLMKYSRPSASRLRRVALRPEALYLPTALGFSTIPYTAIRRVVHAGATLIVETVGGEPFRVETLLREDECAVLASHVEASRRRAMGDGTRRTFVSERLSMLAQGPEPIAAWVARLDGIAASLQATGYRGSAIDREDLRIALDDVDGGIGLRLAAARILTRIAPETRVRVAEAASTSPSKAHAELFRVAEGSPDEIAIAYQAATEEDQARALRRKI